MGHRLVIRLHDEPADLRLSLHDTAERPHGDGLSRAQRSAVGHVPLPPRARYPSRAARRSLTGYLAVSPDAVRHALSADRDVDARPWHLLQRLLAEAARRRQPDRPAASAAGTSRGARRTVADCVSL